VKRTRREFLTTAAGAILETAVRLAQAPKHLAVRALDARRRPIAVSRTT